MWRIICLLGVLAAPACSSDLPPAGPGTPDDVRSIRLFDGAGVDQTRHLFIFRSDTLHLEVRMYGRDGRHITAVPGGVEVSLVFSPVGLATSTAMPGQPLVRAVTTTSVPNDTGSVQVSLRFPADASVKTFGPFECATH